MIRRAIYLASASQYTAAAIQFVGTIIISRLLAPAEVGVFAVGLALIALLQVLTEFGLGTFLVQTSVVDRDRVRGTLGVAMLIAWVAGAILLLLAPFAAGFYRHPGVEPVLQVLALSFFLQPFTVPALGVLQRRLAFGVLFLVNTVRALVTLVATTALALAGHSYMSLAWGVLAGGLAALAVVAALQPDLVFVRPRLRHVREILRFGGYLSASNVLIAVGTYLPDMIVGRALGMGAVGLYSRGRGVVDLFRRVVMISVGQVALPRFSEVHRDGGDLSADYRRATVLLTGLGWPFYAVLGVSALAVIRTLYGERWEAVAPLLQWFCLAQAVFLPAALSGQLLIATGRLALSFWREAFLQTVRLVLVILAAQHSLAAVAASQAFVYALAVAITLEILRRYLTLGPAAFVGPLWRSLAVALAAGAAALAVAAFGPDPRHEAPLSVLLTAAASGLAWLVSLFALRHPLRNEVMTLISRVRAEQARLLAR